MVKTLGIVFVAVLVSIPIVIIDQRSSAGFLYSFFQNQALGIIATVLALNIATVTFLLSQLVLLEGKAGRPLFTNTKKEVRDNVYFMCALFLICLVLIPSLNTHRLITVGNTDYNYVVFLALVIFILVFCTLLEIVKAIFKSTEFIKTTKRD